MKAEATYLNDPQWRHIWDRLEAEVGSPAASKAYEFNPNMAMWVFASPEGSQVAARRAVNVSVSIVGPDADLPDPVYLFSCERLHVFTSARSYVDAEREFKDQVAHYYYHYTRVDPAQLDDDAQSIQRLYRDYFYEKNALP